MDRREFLTRTGQLTTLAVGWSSSLSAARIVAREQEGRRQLTRGPLRVSRKNPRYFCDATGQEVLLVGSHTWNNLVDMGRNDPPEAFDFDACLDFLDRYGHNFIRLWAWDSTIWDTRANGRLGKDFIHHVAPLPWPRTGSGKALDGKPKFDLTQFDSVCFKRLREQPTARFTRRPGPSPKTCRRPKGHMIEPITARQTTMSLGSQAMVPSSSSAHTSEVRARRSTARTTWRSIGGNAGENPDGIYADESGNVYLSGYTRSTDFPVTDAAPQVHGGQKAVFVKLSADFSHLLHAAYVGGTKRDDGRTGFLDDVGNWYLAGETGSPDRPVKNAFQATFAGNGDAMVAKLVPVTHSR